MALATGVEAPSSAVAQLGQLDHRGKVHFGRVTLWLTLGIVGWLTIGLTASPCGSGSACRWPTRRRWPRWRGRPWATAPSSRRSSSRAPSSPGGGEPSYQAGPGLLKALSRLRRGARGGRASAPLGAANRHHTPYWGARLLLRRCGGAWSPPAGASRSWCCSTPSRSSCRSSSASSAWRVLATGGSPPLPGPERPAIAAVRRTLAVNLRRGYPIASLGAACAIALVLHRLWIRAGRPRGVSEVERLAEEELAEAP